MKSRILLLGIGVAIISSACNKPAKQSNATQQQDSLSIKKTAKMNNLISIVEIPVTDFARAVKFYETILNLSIEQMEMDGVTMGVIPNDEGTVNVVLAKGNDYQPTTVGALLYFNAGNDLQPMLSKIEQNGGKIIVPRTQISPEMGFFALFTDTEGNKLGLHSSN